MANDSKVTGGQQIREPNQKGFKEGYSDLDETRTGSRAYRTAGNSEGMKEERLGDREHKPL